MNVLYTGRQQSITERVRKQVEPRLDKLQKIFGTRTAPEARVILELERHLHCVEITVTWRDQSTVGAGEAAELREAIAGALDHLEKQALKQKARWRVKNRHAHPVAARSIRTLDSRPLRPAA